MKGEKCARQKDAMCGFLLLPKFEFLFVLLLHFFLFMWRFEIPRFLTKRYKNQRALYAACSSDDFAA